MRMPIVAALTLAVIFSTTQAHSQNTDSSASIPAYGLQSPNVTIPGADQAGEFFDESEPDFYRTENWLDGYHSFDTTIVKEGRTSPPIFGHNIFNTSSLTFEPSLNIATPASYRLGPGDQVVIDIWGVNQYRVSQRISPDGTIFLNGIGPVMLSGMTVSDANNALQKEFSRMFSGIEGEETYVKVTLGNIRTIQINVMGEVETPGTYSLSSFANVFHALYRSGGVNPIGSMRNIAVIRNSKKIADIDVYDYILNGNSSDFIRVEEGDVIIVPPYETLVWIEGRVKRPMFYELKRGETLSDIISFAGGFTGDAYSRNITVTRYNGTEKQIFTVERDNFAAFPLDDGDRVSVDPVLDRFENMVEITGAVYRPGVYELNDRVSTLKELITKAEGLRGDEFSNRAILTRERSDLSLVSIPIDLAGLMNGTFDDLDLRRNDVLYIPSIYDISEGKYVTVDGAVAQPGQYPFVSNMTIEDLILQAGGMLESASEMKIDISRRMRDPKRTHELNTISSNYTLQLKEGLVVDGQPGFLLEPFDQIHVRLSPGYLPQRNVGVYGEVLYGGTYALTTKGERLSDVIAKAGGLTSAAYAQGAKLVRIMNADEKAVRQTIVTMSNRGVGGRDSVSLEAVDLQDHYQIGIQLDMALKNPGSEYDIILRAGDNIVVPEYVNTVRVDGEVLYSNTILYSDKASLRYYINQAGGFTSRAKKRKVYVINLNGTVSKYRSKRTIEPGSQIIVPSKNDRNRMSFSEIMSLGTTAASIGTMSAAISTMVK